MAAASVGIPMLRQFDIYMPFEFIEKCVQLSCVGHGICWSGSVRDMTDGQLFQNHKNSKMENSGFEQWRSDNSSENVQLAHVQTCINPENMLLISFSKVQLQVLEGRCGFWLSNVQKDESSCAMSAYQVNECSGEVESTILDGLNSSKLTNPSTRVDYVETENNIKISDDLAKNGKNIDSYSVDSIGGWNSMPVDSVSSKEKNAVRSVTGKPPCLPEISSNQLTSINLSTPSDSMKSTLKKNSNENLIENKQVKHFCSETNTVQKLQELVLYEETDCNNLSEEKTRNNKPLQSLPVSLTKKRENKVIKQKTYGRKAKKQYAQEDKNFCPQVTMEMTDVNDNSVIPKKKYMLRGVKIPKCLIEQEKNGRQLVSKNNCKNQNLESADISCQDIENCSSNKRINLTNDHPTLPSTSETPVTLPLLLQSSSRQQQVDLDNVNNRRSKRRKRNNTRVVQCRYCKKMFCDYTGVDEHVKKFHTNEADFVDYIAELKKLKVATCNICNVKLQNRYLLQEHEDRVHSTADSEVCNVCGKKYKNLKSLRNHIRFVHYANGKAHLCHLCPAKFKWAGTLKQHIQEVHEGIREFSCPTCGKEFFRKSQLNRHIRIHGSDASKRITCTLCNKGFWFENNYVRHMKAVHQPQLEEFHCSYCGKGFTQKSSMVAHVQLVHLKIYTYSCKICKMGFTRSKLLQVHMVQMHNETDFVVKNGRQGRFKYSRTAADLLYCHYCNQGFYYKAQVVQHIHQEHTFPYRCDKCKQGFVLKKFLDNHLRKAHGIEVEVPPDNEEAEEENNDAEEALENSTELKSESTILPKCSIATFENSEGIPSETILSPPNTECSEDLLGIPGTDSYGVSTAATSLLLEVAKDGSTVHYFIQHDNTNDKGNQMDNNQQVIEDIASLLLVAEEASSKESLPMTSGQAQAVNEMQSKNAVVHFIPTNVEDVNSSTVEVDT